MMNDGGMNWFDVFTAVVLANLLCGWAGYALWRLKRDESDLKAIGIALACAAVFGLALIARP